MSSKPHDVVVIGAGPNGLTAATLLARAGRRVLVLEQADRTGGLAAADEFHPGYRSAGLWHDSSGVRPAVVEALGLAAHGLAWAVHRPELLALGRAGQALLVPGDLAAKGELPPDEAARLGALGDFVGRVRPVLRGWLDRPPLDPVADEIPLTELLGRALGLRRLGRETMLELLRAVPLSLADWLGEWLSSDLLKAALAHGALLGSFAGPRSPGTAFNWLLEQAAAGPGLQGGGPVLIRALEAAARQAGVEIRLQSRAVRVVVERNVARAVVTETGETIPAQEIAATCDPRQLFLRLLEPGVFPERLERRAAAIRLRGTTAHVLLALGAALELAGRAGVSRARTGATLEELERAFDPVKYRRLPERPVLDLHVPTVGDPTSAPPGHAVLSILVHFVPHDLEGGWDEAARRLLLERVLAVLGEHAPGLSSSLIAAVVRSPADLEQRYALSGGQIHHGEQALDQLLVRPAPGLGGYRTPVPGLFLCGSGAHPGGGLSGVPGALAAAAIVGRRLAALG